MVSAVSDVATTSASRSTVLEMAALLESPTGVLVVPTLADLIDRVDALEEQVHWLTHNQLRPERG